MQTDMFTQHTVEVRSPATDYVVVEATIAGQVAREAHIEEDAIDWCAWWAEYAESLE